MVLITYQFIASGVSCRGGFSRSQYSLLGVPFPPPKGWKKRVIGTEISEHDAMCFQALRCQHCKASLHPRPLLEGTVFGMAPLVPFETTAHCSKGDP
jgi:hypothetical protein